MAYIDPPVSIEDLHGDHLEIHHRQDPRNLDEVDGTAIIFIIDDPDCDTLAYDLAGTIKLRDHLTAVIEAQTKENQ